MKSLITAGGGGRSNGSDTMYPYFGSVIFSFRNHSFVSSGCDSSATTVLRAQPLPLAGGTCARFFGLLWKEGDDEPASDTVRDRVPFVIVLALREGLDFVIPIEERGEERSDRVDEVDGFC